MSRRSQMYRWMAALTLAPLACGQPGGSEPTDWMSETSMRGDGAFAITTSCPPDSPCIPVCVDQTADPVCNESMPPAQGGCWITGGGFVLDEDGHDSYGGNGMPMKDGRIRGEWEHVDHGTGNKFHGKVKYLVCRRVDEPGPGQPSGPKKDFHDNQAYYGGEGRWFTQADGWKDGFWFDVFIEDHGEPGNKPGPGNHGSKGPDEYYFAVRQLVAPNQSGPVVYQVGGPIQGGNLQLHPPNNGHPFTASTLPSWVSFQP